jgi:hypothetical protein
MYRHGLGDCFLVSLPGKAGNECHILIDCGVVRETPDAPGKMDKVAHDIKHVIGKRIDVVVVSHEHWDHVSGFLQARSVFDKIEIGEVWLAWTEDSADPAAESRTRERRRALRGLRALVGSLSGVDSHAARRLQGPLGLCGATSGPSARDAIDYLLGHHSRPRVRYLRGGGLAPELPSAPEARGYVLGPPFEESSNTAGIGRPTSAFASGVPLFAAVGGLGLDHDRFSDLSQAFETRYRLPREKAKTQAFFRRTYERAEDSWRRIDNDWLGAVEHLALALDSHTNNTSLVLALELELNGRVLLFSGDAQLGDWLSWKDYRWKRGPLPSATVSATDLLKRTVIYKVGHHGAYCAALREDKLDLLCSPELVALLPVCRDTAARMGWNMPFPATLDQLRRKTRGRLIRSDDGMPERPDEVGEVEWANFANHVRVDPKGLFTEYVV